MTDDVMAALVRDLLAEADDDYIGLWAIPWLLKRAVPNADEAERRRLSEPVIRALVDAGLQIGDVEYGRGFVPWDGDDTVERLLAAWDALGREPNIYEVAWFARPGT